MVDDYERMARVIRYLDGQHPEKPSLEQIARVAGLSPAHFHRMFVRWAGVTPKDFTACLTLNHAKDLLLRGTNVLEAALSAGLSGPGRLHDLCVNLVAATPGEIKSKGQGLNIISGFAESPFGEVFIAESSRGICHISFPDGKNQEVESELQITWPKAIIKMDNRRIKQIAQMIFPKRPVTSSKGSHEKGFAGKNSGNNHLRLYVRGTPFQVRVWRALLTIPEGSLTSYGSLAKMIGTPSACRAVGTAVGANPLAYLIPCHRVIRETGIIGHYHWSPHRKRAMLIRETAAEKI